MKRLACDLFSLSPSPAVSQKDETIRIMSKSADRQLSIIFKIIQVSGVEGFLLLLLSRFSRVQLCETP